MNSKIMTMKRKNHKWVDNHNSSDHHKNQTCENCGWNRQWLGAQWQTWEYYKNERTTWNRPDCK